MGFKSATYEQGTTPDRPGSVQAAVPTGAKRPQAWQDIPISLIYLSKFDLAGTEAKELHGFDVRIASPEKVLIDGAHLPARMGGVLGLARVAELAADADLDWNRLVHLGVTSIRSRVSLRRLAALLEVLGRAVQEPLASAASTPPGGDDAVPRRAAHPRRRKRGACRAGRSW